MRYLKDILKISLVLMLLMLCIGSIHAADDSQSALASANDDDFDLDDDIDEDLDEEDDGFDDDEEYDFEDLDLDDDYLDDEIDDVDDWDDDYLDGEIDDVDDLDLDEDDNESDYDYSDFDFLKLKITYYLDRYGNCTDHDWIESEEFLSEYQIYLSNTTEYKLNESAEGYQTYLKIFDSITSTFGDYNLTENETEYLKFMVIFYLNHYGNVSANYTWNESDDFRNFTPPIYCLMAMRDTARGSASSSEPVEYLACNNVLDSFYVVPANNSTSLNQTAGGNGGFDIPMPHYNDGNLLILLFAVVIMIFMML